MIGLSTRLFDTDGYAVIQKTQSSEVPLFKRRVTKTATLDGSNSLSDFGFAASDGNWIIKTTDRDTVAVLENMIKNHNKLILSTKQGAFLGVISELDTRSTPIEITFLPESIIS